MKEENKTKLTSQQFSVSSWALIIRSTAVISFVCPVCLCEEHHEGYVLK